MKVLLYRLMAEGIPRVWIVVQNEQDELLYQREMTMFEYRILGSTLGMAGSREHACHIDPLALGTCNGTMCKKNG